MRKSKRFESMPVISLEEGQQIGHVKSLVVDPAGKKVAALIIEQKGWFKEQRFIPYHKVKSAGSDAITIEKTANVERATGLPDIVKLVREKVGIIGARLVAENGTLLGNVDEYYVDLATGTIAGLEFSGNLLNSFIKGRAYLDTIYVRTLGKEVVVITNEALDNIFKLDGGLQETVKNIRETTGHLWENTVQKTKDLGTTLNKSIEKVKQDIKTATNPEDEAVLSADRKKNAAPAADGLPDVPTQDPDAEKSERIVEDPPAQADAPNTENRTPPPPQA
ncbi:MAG: PRC-barrel domain-containing protein [Desulfotomaculaceae bacterium]|nr:PRC-barrel domain-containing protein [Desulfotomaculaceae bacterium]